MYNSKIREICYAYAMANKMALPLSVEDSFNAVALWVEDTVTGMAPYIGSNNHWYVYDKTTQTFKDSGVEATKAGPTGATGPIGPTALEFTSSRTTSTEPMSGTSFSASSASYFNRTPITGDYFLQLVIGSEGTSVEGRSWITNNVISSISDGVYNYQIRSVVETTGETGPQGPQGPQGPMPPLVSTRGNSTSDAMSQQGIENIFYGSQVTLGVNSTASGADATAIGYGATASGKFSTALGRGATVNSNYSIALGQGATVTLSGTSATALGRGATANFPNTIAIGYGAKTNGEEAIALGHSAYANFPNTIAIGYGAKANGTESTAIGVNCTVDANNSILIGAGANCDTDNTFQVGNYPLLDLTTGLIPSERISQNIPTITDNGDGTLSIAIGSAKYKVAIVTE